MTAKTVDARQGYPWRNKFLGMIHGASLKNNMLHLAQIWATIPPWIASLSESGW